MKKCICFSLLFFILISSKAQIWNWAKAEPYGVDPGPFYLDIISADNAGNMYYSQQSGATPNIARFDPNGNFSWDKKATCYSCFSYCLASYSAMEYLGGIFHDTMIMETDTIMLNRGHYDVFVAKFDSTGLIKWTAHSNNKSNVSTFAKAIATDGLGNAYLTGEFGGGSLIWGRDSIYSTYSVPFVMKVDFNGNPKWLRAGKGTTFNSGNETYSIVADKSGNSYITGYYYGSLVFGNDTLQTTTTNVKKNAFLVKYDSAGNELWAWNAKMITGSGSSDGVGICADYSGNVYLAGNFNQGTVTIGSYTFGPNGHSNPYFAKFNSNGSLSWGQEIKELDGNPWLAVSLASDTNNDEYLLVDCTSTSVSYMIGIGSDTIKTIYHYDFADVLAEFDTAGIVKCATMFSEGGENDGDEMNVSKSGAYVYVVGDIQGTCEFGSDTISGSDKFYIGSWYPCNGKVQNSVNNISDDGNCKIFPNPSSGSFTLSLSNITENCNVEIYNVLGERVLKETLLPTSRGQDDKVMDLSNQPNGIYLYRVITENGELVGEGKVVVQK